MTGASHTDPPAASLPAWAPAWACELVTLSASGAASVIVLHGNTQDLVPLGDAAYGTLPIYLAEQVFGQYDVVLHYDVARGLRPFAGRSAQQQRAMVGVAEKAGIPLTPPGGRSDPQAVLAALDQLFSRVILATTDRLKVAVVIDHASFLFPAGEPGQLSAAGAAMLVTVLNWAASPHLKRLDATVVLVDEQRAHLSPRLLGNPHVAAVEVRLPSEPERRAFLEAELRDTDETLVADLSAAHLAGQTAGLSLVNIRNLIAPAVHARQRIDAAALKGHRKRLIEQQCHGLLEFVEPKWTLDAVVGFEAAKQRFRDDARLLAMGALDCLPMGYLICGPVGTGKTFLVTCAAGEIGIPCVTLRNLRGKYVGETEGNLERVLAVLREVGPVMVIIDEADAALGDREQEGDSGTGKRFFAMLATQMADTRYRGKILWTLMTARPDLLPIDLKRQGRAEVHIPLFYPESDAELAAMIRALARKVGARLADGDLSALTTTQRLTGSDVEGILVRAWRVARLAGTDVITREMLAQIVEEFLPSAQGLRREYQELAAIMECTDRQFLPRWARERMEQEGGRDGLEARMTGLGRMLEAR